MKIKGPQFVRYFVPIIDVLKELGGSGRPTEVCDLIARQLNVSDRERSELIESGSPRFDKRVHWARFYLAKAGYVDASKRGVWSLTEKGQAVTKWSFDDAIQVFHAVQNQLADAKAAPATTSITTLPSEETLVESTTLWTDITSYRIKLLEVLKALPPAGFERLCQRILREAGFEQVTVTGRTGDGGIDGHGILQLNPFVSFKVLFQCKRYAGTVGASQVRDFRGAMMGRADKGIIMTTGTFTADAQKEAHRDGVPPIELVNGEKLIDMFENLELGLIPRKTFDIDQHFFEAFQT
jgi:restriction system protein